jgi:hypothetical protein
MPKAVGPNPSYCMPIKKKKKTHSTLLSCENAFSLENLKFEIPLEISNVNVVENHWPNRNSYKEDD